MKALRQLQTVLLAGLLLFGSLPQGFAARYATDRLELMARRLEATAWLDTIAADGLYRAPFSHAGLPLCAEVTDGCVSHIGYAFFSPEHRMAFGTEACRFVERYALELAMPLRDDISAAERMRVDGVTATGNILSSLTTLCTDTTVSIHTLTANARTYSMSWLRGEEQLASISFPIDYDLLVGTDMDERERRLPALITSSRPCATPPPPLPTQLHRAWQDNYYTLEAPTYLIDQLSARQFFYRDDEGTMTPIFSPRMPVESLANLLTAAVSGENYTMNIKLSKYGLKTELLTATLQQWLCFCRQSGCRLFFGIISMTDTEADCELLAHHAELGYNHVMRLKVPLQVIADGQGTIEARLTAYVTASRISNIFQDINPNTQE